MRGVDVPPRPASQEHRNHAGSKCGEYIVVEAISHIGDLAWWIATLTDDLVEERRRRLLDAPPGRRADEVHREVEPPQQLLSASGLVAGDADQQAYVSDV